ncbi:MAG: hypothetical protein FH753_11105 [Firmicutes bacterium]|nr:hypothetical protein [Bacillota bacterium]
MIFSKEDITLKARHIDRSEIYRVDIEMDILYKTKVIGSVNGRLFNFAKARNDIEDSKEVYIDDIFYNAGQIEWDLWQEILKTEESFGEFKDTNRHYHDAFSTSFLYHNIFLIKSFNIKPDYRHKFPIVIELISAVCMEEIPALAEVIIIHKPSNNELLKKKIEIHLKHCINFDKLHDSEFIFHFWTYQTTRKDNEQ